jgi:type I restriction enzyme S subunit
MELTKTNAALSKSKGYKSTEIGLVPEDWELKTLGEVGDVRMCKRIFNYQTSERGDIPFYKIGTFGKEPDAYISSSLYNEFRRKYSFPKKGTVLISAAGTIGRTIVYDGNDAYFQDSNIVWIDNNNQIISDEYLKHVFPIVKFNTEGGTIQRLYNSILKSGRFPAPPTHTEQKAIASALSDVDALIFSLEKLIAKKKAIKQGAMQELLTPPHKGGKRLPGFSGEWERVKVDKVINVARGGSPRPIQNFITTSPDGINWIKIGDTSVSSKYIVSSVEKIIPDGANFSRRVNCGDFLLSNSMSFGRPYILKIDGCIHDGWLVLQNYQTYFNTEFLYYTLMSKDVFNQYIMKASGSSVLNLNKEIVKTVELNRPTDMNEQKAIAQILSDMDKEIESLELKKEKYHQIKQGMMQELLTGKTRLV